jgi:alpha-galactosidase
LHSGTLVRADHPDPAAYGHGVVAPDRAAGLFCYAQLRSSERAVPAPMCLPGLDPDRHYRVTVVEPVGAPMVVQSVPAEFASRILTGRVLAEVGVRPPILAPEQAWLVEVTAQDTQ